MVWIFSGILAVLIILIGILFYLSPGKIEPIRDKYGKAIPGSVAEIKMLKLNGMQQGIILHGKNEKNPVLLFLHGGPGLPEFFLSYNSSLNLEEEFTVCWWEQRGSGLSYRSDIPPETMTLEQMIDDTVELTNYLRELYGQEKIYLMGHSWGSFLGMHVIQKHPELYHAYFGVGQVADQLASERLAYDYMCKEARRLGNKKMEKEMLKYNVDMVDSVDLNYIKGIRSSAMNRLGGGFMHEVSTFKDVLLPLLTCPAYTLSQKASMVKGVMFSVDHLFNLTCKYALSEKIPKVEIPVFIFHGRYDIQTSFDLEKEYFEMLDAPAKKFHTFERSAHSPLFEESDLFQSILLNDVSTIKDE